MSVNGELCDLSTLPLSEDDLNEIVEYITCWLRNPAATDRFIDDVEAAIME